MAFGNIWLGGRAMAQISIDPFTTDAFFPAISLNNLHVIDGVTRISRILFRYHLESALVDHSGGGGLAMWPMNLSVVYFPSPDGELSGQPDTIGGDALWRESAQWQPYAWTDGTIHATKWWAAPDQPRSAQGNRLIQDKSVASLFMGFQYMHSEAPVDDTNFVPAAVTGWVQVDYLLSNAEI